MKKSTIPGFVCDGCGQMFQDKDDCECHEEACWVHKKCAEVGHDAKYYASENTIVEYCDRCSEDLASLYIGRYCEESQTILKAFISMARKKFRGQLQDLARPTND